jgi:hypothetical protein
MIFTAGLIGIRNYPEFGREREEHRRCADINGGESIIYGNRSTISARIVQNLHHLIDKGIKEIYGGVAVR